MKFFGLSVFLLVAVSGTLGQENGFMNKALKDMRAKFGNAGINLPQFIDRKIEADNATLTDTTCRQNMTYTTCGGCDRNCGDGDMVACTMNCKPAGCYCEQNYVRDFNGNCILESDCPSVDTPQVIPLINELNDGSKNCPANYTYLQCGTCHESCDGPIMCTRECKEPGCYCVVTGALDSNKNCILKSDCPNGDSDMKIGQSPVADESLGKVLNDEPMETPAEECKANETWNGCGNKCESTCKEEKMICPLICAPGACVCNSGYVRNDEGTCILKEECPK